jgi:hypothetical protein
LWPRYSVARREFLAGAVLAALGFGSDDRRSQIRRGFVLVLVIYGVIG